MPLPAKGRVPGGRLVHVKLRDTGMAKDEELTEVSCPDV